VNGIGDLGRKRMAIEGNRHSAAEDLIQVPQSFLQRRDVRRRRAAAPKPGRFTAQRRARGVLQPFEERLGISLDVDAIGLVGGDVERDVCAADFVGLERTRCQQADSKRR
jgi:hypothetical protein